LIPLEVPLHRLLRRGDLESLLAKFQALLPDGELALLGTDGRVVVGGGIWPEGELRRLMAQVSRDQCLHTADLLLQPLVVRSQLAGALAVRGLEGQRPEPCYGEQVLGCLQQGLTLLLSQALEARDLGRETLDRYREINLLYTIGEAISGRLDPDEILQLTLQEAKRVIHATVGMVRLSSLQVTADGEQEMEVKASFGDVSDGKVSGELVDQVISQVCQSGRPAIVNKLPTQVDDTSRLICAPLKTRDQVVGVILLGRPEGQPEFAAGDEKLLTALAGQAANAIETARLHQEEVNRQRLEEELAIGRQIQLSLLPEACPVVPGWEFAAVYRPATQVGGDLYDFLEFPGDPRQIGLVIADVTGKGVPAALFMALCRTVVRVNSNRDQGPAAALMQANQFIARDNRPGLFLSAFYAILDSETGRLVYSSAGHNWPLWLRSAAGEIEELAAHGIVLGLFRDIQLEERAIEVGPGDLLVFYTDGVPEAMNGAGEMFGEGRLQAVVGSDPEASSQQVAQAILQAVEAFTGDIPPSDDLTLFVLKRQRS